MPFQPLHDWLAVVIFPDQSSDPGGPEHYREFFDSGRIQTVYLDKLPKHAPNLGVQLIYLIGVDEAYVPEQLRAIKSAIIASPPETQSDWLELLETILVYKLPRLSRDEVKEMLGDILNVELKQTRFYQDVFAEGQKEGKQEGKQEECINLIARLIRHKLGIHPHIGKALHQLPNYSIASLEELAEALLNFEDVSDLTKWLNEHKPDIQNLD